MVSFMSLVSTERWCRLRGNLLFYFKSDDQFSDVQGVIVLEKCRPIEDTDRNNQGDDGYGFIIGELELWLSGKVLALGK